MKILLIFFMTLSLFGSDYSLMRESFEKGDVSRAISYARYSAANGNVAAMYNLGLLYYSDGNIDKAHKWLKKSVKNNGKGKLGIGLIEFSQAKYIDVIDSLRNSSSGEVRDALIDVSHDFIQNKSLASAESYLLLGKLFFIDEIVYQDSRLALLLIGIAANKGDERALEIMGDAYNIMREFPLKAPILTNSLSLSLAYYLKASNLGNLDSMAKMGNLFIVGPRGIRNVQRGVELIQKSADKGSALGAKFLGDLYMKGIDFNGLGVNLDLKMALEWYRKASDICELDESLTTAQEYSQYYKSCKKEHSIMPGYNLLFKEF